MVRKLLAPRIIVGDVMRKTFKAALNVPSGLTMEKLGTNLFLFSLRTEEEQAHILQQGPWVFEKFLLVLSKPIPMIKPTTMEFKYAMFWVHFCELPMDLYNLSKVDRFGNAIGEGIVSPVETCVIACDSICFSRNPYNVLNREL